MLVLRRLLLLCLTTLLMAVLAEPWVQVAVHSDWPKTVKNVLFLLPLAGSAIVVGYEHRWREFGTRIDVLLAVLAATMVLSGLLGAVPMVVVGKALYVYLRGVIVFYAIRALKPSRQWIRVMLWSVGIWAGINSVIALAQVAIGPPAYRVFGWTDLSAASIHRAQGLFDHPNDLGHLTGLALLGVLAVSSASWAGWHRWAAAGLFATGLAASQSRESLLGVAVGAAVIAARRRLPMRKLVAAVLVVVAMAATPIVAMPGVRTEVVRRVWGVSDAIGLPIGHGRPQPDPNLPVCGPPSPEPKQDGIPGSPCRQLKPEREIRILYAQQGFSLLAARPLLGYGVGTFGGIVALEHDPRWHQHPRLGPGGFDLFGFHGKTVDSFWLHLIVEVGVIGFACYLLWLAGLARRVRRSPWALACIAFGVVIAVFSPALEGPLVPPLLFAVIGIAMQPPGAPLRVDEGPFLTTAGDISCINARTASERLLAG